MSESENEAERQHTPFDLFETDAELERKGVRIDYGDFWFQVARSGGKNTAFADKLRKLTSPYRRAIETETMDPKLLDKLTVETFIDTCLLSWGSRKYGDGVLVARDGSPIRYSRENARELLEELPELLTDLIRQSAKVSIYRTQIAEEDSGN